MALQSHHSDIEQTLHVLPLGCQQSPVFMRGHLTRASAPFVSVGPNMRVNGEKTLTLSPALRGPQTRRGTAEQVFLHHLRIHHIFVSKCSAFYSLS
ncbi:Hypothetical predicted protein [Xyrichtys novacula]|uniref:Uncharacterized protein n=1 Tax=Xyrichtys novacula TaxID=13765 RepID=A0AAV1G473_XYRNO|nr:Hypothetical predicted protein [Xyrichtys novacula]